MFKAGVLAGDELLVSDEGVPQGRICSPILANIYAHYVLDTWFHEVVKKHCRVGLNSSAMLTMPSYVAVGMMTQSGSGWQ